MRKISLPLATALMIVSCVIGIGAGYWLTPQYRLSMYDKNAMDLGAPDKWLDLRYLDAMIEHHRGAMLLASQASKSRRKEISTLAADILKNEPEAIGELYRWKKKWYEDYRIVQDPNSPHLGKYDRTFDLRFLNALIAHHENGIRMTREIRLKSSRSEILDNADTVELFLRNGVGMLKDWRKAWYNVIDTNPLP
ncbi:MAG: DUF305 domain-containing protein [Chlorobiaceae bacterium]|nr:DUF305 domain-containing protein [Chlorobiaceae bacterium]